jgi:hypothetical protein
MEITCSSKHLPTNPVENEDDDEDENDAPHDPMLGATVG